MISFPTLGFPPVTGKCGRTHKLLSVRSWVKKRTAPPLHCQLPHVAFGTNDFQETILGQATRAAVGELASKLTKEVIAAGGSAGLTGKVAAVSGGEIYLNIGANAGVAEGSVFAISRILEEIKDPDTGAVIDLIDEPVCEITIIEVREATCIGRISAGSGPPRIGDLATLKN